MSAGEDANGENEDRRLSEVEFVTSAYTPDEAWCEDEIVNPGNGNICIHRRLDLANPASASGSNVATVSVRLTLTLTPTYPANSALLVDGSVLAKDGTTNTSTNESYSKLQKVVYNILPRMISSCRQLALDVVGEEAVFLVLDHAEEWIQSEWPTQFKEQQENRALVKGGVSEATTTSGTTGQLSQGHVMLGRRLIYSHHIISKIKRRDIRDLAKQFHLTGYMKIGWPGLLLIEGSEEDCISFYDTIRPWSWQYLVVRGEQQESITTTIGEGLVGDDMLKHCRKFTTFQEVDDMSIVAQHCRDVGLEALFQTSMKNYNSNNNENETINNDRDDKAMASTSCYGALVLVDHMNHGKAYRKWLRKTSQETDCYVLMKQYSPSSGADHRGDIIVVGLVAQDSYNVAQFLKRWRTSRVDIDSMGKPCLERQMSVLIEGTLVGQSMDQLQPKVWTNKATATQDNSAGNLLGRGTMATLEQDVNVPSWEALLAAVALVGGKSWHEMLSSTLSRR